MMNKLFSQLSIVWSNFSHLNTKLKNSLVLKIDQTEGREEKKDEKFFSVCWGCKLI